MCVRFISPPPSWRRRVVWFIAFIGEPAFRHAKQDTGAALFITVTGTIYVADEISPA